MSQASSEKLNPQKPSPEKTGSEKPSSPKSPRTLASSADVGLVPASSGDEAVSTAAGVSTTASSPVSPSQKAPASGALSPQERKNQAVQRQLETALAQSLPGESAAASKGLILGLEPGRSGKALTVTLTPRWYQLAPDQQDAIASALWEQRSSLKIQRLDLQDSEGRTIARPPVIGNQVVILRR